MFGKPGPDIEMLTIEEAAKLLTISTATLRRLQQSRVIRFIRVGRGVRFVRNDVIAYLESRRVEPITK